MRPHLAADEPAGDADKRIAHPLSQQLDFSE